MAVESFLMVLMYYGAVARYVAGGQVILHDNARFHNILKYTFVEFRPLWLTRGGWLLRSQQFFMQRHIDFLLNEVTTYLLCIQVIMELCICIMICKLEFLDNAQATENLIQAHISFKSQIEETKVTFCSEMDMPRESKVPLQDQINVVKEFMQHFVTNVFPAYSSPTWLKMSKYLGGKWTPHNVYTNVRENRNQILTRAREEMGIAILDDQNKQSQPQQIDATVMNYKSSSDSEDEAWSPDKNEKKKKKNRKETDTIEFELVLTEKEWDSIKPEGTVLYGKRTKEILQRGIWTNVISIAFWKQHKTNCAFVYKRANVKTGEDDGSYIVDIYGKCKSTTCGNTFRGYGEKHPDKEGLIIHVNTRDTNSVVHDEVKRPLNGKRRQEAAQEFIHEGCAVWKRHKAREVMQYGDLEPAFLPNGDVMRQAKKECIHANLNVKPDDSRDLIRTIENISVQPEYGDLIQAVGSSPFYTFYSTPAQLDAYKKYIRLKKSNSRICVDATGSLVRILDRPGDTKTGHIFLYSIVVNFENTTQPVHQMLSEKHETEFIEYWLKQWLRRGAPKPKEAVCDYSRALISALCLAFNNRPIKFYLDTCFAILENTRGVIERPATVIRIDVAHLIHMICRWKSFEKANQSCIKEFFVRCVALMVECETITSFGEIYSLTCAVGLQQYEDSQLELMNVITTKDARKKLEGYIASRGIEDKLKKHKPRDEVDYSAGPFEIEVSEDTTKLDDDTKVGNRRVEWIEQQRKRAEKCLRKGLNPNAFYLPDFIERLHKLAMEFPLWTGVAMPSGSPHATSSYVESYFNDIKNRVFTDIKPPVRVDIFLKNLARNIIGETNLFVSKMKRAEITETQLRQAELRPAITCNEELKKVDTRQAEQGKADMGKAKHTEDATVLLPQLKFNTMEEPMFLEDVSYFVEITPSITNEVTLNDSDLFSTENWRGKALLSKDVDDFGDEETGSDHWIAERSMAESHVLDHSYTKLDTSQSPMESSVILTVEKIKNDDNSRSRTNGLDKSTEPDNLHLDSETSRYLQENNPSNNDGLDFIDSEAFDEEKIVSSSKEPGENAAMRLEELQTAKTSKYFRRYPEIRQRNLLTTKLKKPYLLPNGSHCTRGVEIDGDTLFIRNTCPFDSVVHVLMTSAIDNLQYAAFLKKSQNSTLKFVSYFLDTGVTQNILRERVKILRNFYQPEIALGTDSRVLSYSMNTWDSIENIVEYTMKSEPSVHKREDCSHCEGRTYSYTSISPNHNIITRRGFGALPSALAFKPFVNGVKCRCPGMLTLFSEPNVHLFIDLDIRGPANRRGAEDDPKDIGVRSKSGLRGQLGEFPLTMDLNVKKKGQKKGNATVKYSLTGVVGYTPGHFIAYCRRPNGIWQVYNDMINDIATCSSSTEIEPHLAIYIR